MKQKILVLLQRLGHFQAQLFLTLLFWLVLTPYALLLRLVTRDMLPGGHWVAMEKQPVTLEDLRRSF
ncbi:hypothetical protein JCM30471_17480 [Desulfuromonas carbonis]|uniref:hypothetical protein n=1 Tax=Desulfuromonas sp. DDH964 TaxID=1823759 RepID=UPI00078B4BB7|nr:hypothetical protein [Desulfuromonas sp. DDH964]AMV73345.1 hypothetical protein DBW_3037 [Desulfuromonas sp. DDH964]